jgi:predicted transcriptional regulator
MNAVSILNWVEKELFENRTDTIHDLLAYLAEQMIEMNKARNEEIKGFLKWLEREIGIAVDELQNKTAIKEYHEHDFGQLLTVLKKNKKKLAVDPSDRKTQELIEEHFTKSMAVLAPIKTRIAATDDLIDEIVYRLYGLSKEEIAIVKGESRCHIL